MADGGKNGAAPLPDIEVRPGDVYPRTPQRFRRVTVHPGTDLGVVFPGGVFADIVVWLPPDEATR